MELLELEAKLDRNFGLIGWINMYLSRFVLILDFFQVFRRI
jgi:hypothetical protein